MRSRALRIMLLVCVLFCIGVPGCRKAPSHSVTLTWNAPSATPGVTVAAYNVYRGDTPTGQFVRIASRVPGPPYEDRTVASERTYYYAVTALDQVGHESKYSQQIQARIP